MSDLADAQAMLSRLDSEVEASLTENARLKAREAELLQLLNELAAARDVLDARIKVALVVLGHAVERAQDGKTCLPELLSTTTALRGQS